MYDLPRVTVDVQIVVEDGRRDTMLKAAQAAYDVGAQLDVTCDMNVIPRFPVVSDTLEKEVGLNNQILTASGASQRGFLPVYGYVAVGGTFDHLHAGHKMLLLTSMSHTTRRLRIGVTSTALLANKKYAKVLQPFEARRDAVLRYVTSVRNDIEFEVDEISDMPGGTDAIEGVEALVVSPETEGAVGAINTLRRAKGFGDMGKIAIAYVGGATDGERVSSTKLRALI